MCALIRFSLLGSGSRGNAILIVSGSARILVDGGLSYKQLQLRAGAVGETLDSLDAVFVTHEHRDHVNGVGVLARKLHTPVYITRATFDNLPGTVGEIPDIEFFDAGDTISAGDLEVTSYSVSHDAVDPVSYVIRSRDAKLGMASDLGHVPHLVKQRLQGSHALILESNYCPDMLLRGSYPPQVQQRIRGKHGHLSNSDMNALLADLVHDGLRLVVIAHISQQNNDPRLARDMASSTLGSHGAVLHVARQDEPTPMFEVCP